MVVRGGAAAGAARRGGGAGAAAAGGVPVVRQDAGRKVLEHPTVFTSCLKAGDGSWSSTPAASLEAGWMTRY